MTPPSSTTRAQSDEAITGIQAMMGEGVVEARGFWADAWSQVIRRTGAIIGITWILIVAAMAVFGPVIASGHPVVLREIDPATGTVVETSSPLLEHLTTADVLLLVLGIVGPLWIFLPMPAPLPRKRSQRLGILAAGAAQAAITLVAALLYRAAGDDGSLGFLPPIEDAGRPILWVLVALAALVAAGFFAIPSVVNPAGRAALVGLTGAVAVAALASSWNTPLNRFDYAQREAAGQIDATYTLVPWSPAQRFGDRETRNLPPGSTSAQGLRNNLLYDVPAGPVDADRFPVLLDRAAALPLPDESRAEIVADLAALADDAGPVARADLSALLLERLADDGRPYHLGTDASGQDVLSQLIHASRLAISIGFVSTGIAVLIGVTLGALMGYFGGLVDILLYRVVEIFMAIPVLVILIVAAGVLPRNTYVMMAIIGLFTWHGAARFTRAEFFKLRNQDFVQSARAVGLPLRSILFRHMLPNGVTPVLVDASFAIAVAILFEAILSYLGLGPADQASWGRLLADATGETARLNWWLATFPGVAIFLTVLSYNLVGEALRDAIDPKLKKARV